MNDERLEVREVPTNDDTLASELLAMLKRSLTRSHKLIVALIIIIFVNNLVWIYAWNLPSEETDSTVTSYDIDSEDNGNAVYNESGKVNINGENQKDGNYNQNQKKNK